MTTDCTSIDPLVTSYVDQDLAMADREAVDRHLRVCPPCKARVAAEQEVRGLVQASRSRLTAQSAPASLHHRCADLAASTLAPIGGVSQASRQAGWTRRAKLVPVALAASLVIIASGALLYEATDRSATVLAAELAADHVKCFAVNDLLGTHETPTTVEREMMAGFGWHMQVPADLERAGLELVGARPCLYAEGKIAHIMYRYQGQPVSVFMLPRTVRHDDLVDVLGHEAAIWSVGDRTFVLVARESRVEVRRMTSLVRAAFH
ncbi:MAG: zf-HC2 domain-containing protein [Vicinamibacterales bacterium]